MYPRYGLGGEIFVLGSIIFNRESMDSRFLHAIPFPLYILFFNNSMLRSNISIHQISVWCWPIGVSHGIGK